MESEEDDGKWIVLYSDKLCSTYGTDFSDFVRGTAVIVVWWLHSVFAHRLNGTYAHSLLVVVVVSLLLANKKLVTVTREVRW